jgi:hypothetical protein
MLLARSRWPQNKEECKEKQNAEMCRGKRTIPRDAPTALELDFA